MSTAPSFLVIRRDNIGDLVCTTPLIHALREHYPEATICALVNSYNAPALANNPDLDAVYSYTKAKHREKGQSVLGVHLARLRLIMQLRRLRFDYVILAAPGFQRRVLPLARLLRPRHILGYVDPARPSGAIDIPVPYRFDPKAHEAEETFRLLEPLGITGTPPPVRVYPGAAEKNSAANLLVQAGWPDGIPIIGVHISARKPSQRWPARHSAELMKEICRLRPSRFLLFWSPGAEDHALHPGDDAKAEEIMREVSGLPVIPYPTQHLSQLIAGLSLCDQIICSDGGAMHLAAGLGKPILCFFGKSDAMRWHPWGVPYVLLQKPRLEVTDISVDEAMDGFGKLVTP